MKVNVFKYTNLVLAVFPNERKYVLASTLEDLLASEGDVSYGEPFDFSKDLEFSTLNKAFAVVDIRRSVSAAGLDFEELEDSLDLMNETFEGGELSMVDDGPEEDNKDKVLSDDSLSQELGVPNPESEQNDSSPETPAEPKDEDLKPEEDSQAEKKAPKSNNRKGKNK